MRATAPIAEEVALFDVQTYICWGYIVIVGCTSLAVAIVKLSTRHKPSCFKNGCVARFLSHSQSDCVADLLFSYIGYTFTHGFYCLVKFFCPSIFDVS